MDRPRFSLHKTSVSAPAESILIPVKRKLLDQSEQSNLLPSFRLHFTKKKNGSGHRRVPAREGRQSGEDPGEPA